MNGTEALGSHFYKKKLEQCLVVTMKSLHWRAATGDGKLWGYGNGIKANTCIAWNAVAPG